VLAKEGLSVPVTDLFGLAGRRWLGQADLAPAYRRRVGSLLELIEHFDAEVSDFESLVATQLGGHDGFRAVQLVPGVGPVLAAIFVAEVDDVGRFPGPEHLSSWAGLTPRHRESDTRRDPRPHHKTGFPVSALGRRQRGPTVIARLHHRVSDRRGRPIGRVAAARKLLTLVYYGLRDGHIRCLAELG
jgi:transposase